MKNVLDALDIFISICDKLKIPYAVLGGIAVRGHGIPRATYDVDCAAIVSREQLKDVFDAVENEGGSVLQIYRTGWVDTLAGMPLVKFQLLIADENVDVDLFLAEPPFLKSVMSRRSLIPTDRGKVWLVSPEDLILMKLLSFRPRDQGDILDVIFVQGSLDQTYLRLWAIKLGVTSQLDEIQAQANQ